MGNFRSPSELPRRIKFPFVLHVKPVRFIIIARWFVDVRVWNRNGNSPGLIDAHPTNLQILFCNQRTIYTPPEHQQWPGINGRFHAHRSVIWSISIFLRERMRTILLNASIGSSRVEFGEKQRKPMEICLWVSWSSMLRLKIFNFHQNSSVARFNSQQHSTSNCPMNVTRNLHPYFL